MTNNRFTDRDGTPIPDAFFENEPTPRPPRTLEEHKSFFTEGFLDALLARIDKVKSEAQAARLRRESSQQ